MSLVSSLASMLSRSAKFATAAALAWAVVGVWLLSSYDQRGDWYELYGASGSLATGVWISTVACFFTFVALLEPAQRRRPLTILVPAIVMLACVVQVGVRWFHPSPSLEGAHAAFEAGEHEHALAELSALDAAEQSSPAATELRAKLELHAARTQGQHAIAEATLADDKRLLEVSQGSLKLGATLVLRRTWADPDKQRTARRRLIERARAIADDAWERRDGPALGRIADDTRGLDEPFTSQCEARALLAMARACLDSGRIDCAQEALDRLELTAGLGAPLEDMRVEFERELEALMPSAPNE